MPISDRTRKILWGNSGNRCAICRTELVKKADLDVNQAIVGDECHIVARENDGPRGASALTAKERDNYKNLILLCKVDHKRIDDQPEKYTVQKLTAIKSTHEKWVRETLSQQNAKGKGDSLILAHRIELGRDLTQILGGSHMSQFDNDELQNTKEVEAVGNFLQNIQDYCDLWDEIPSLNRIQVQFDFQQEITNLEAMDFIIYGCQHRERWKFGNVIDYFLVLYIFILRKNNPRVQRNGEMDKILGIDKSNPSEFNPRLLYMRQPI
jgi:hypothetical protein